MVGKAFHKEFREGGEHRPSKLRFRHDLMFRDVAYVYPVTITKNGLGESIQTYAAIPFPVACSFQDHALDTEHRDPTDPGSHYARVFTRYRNAAKWHDRVVCRGKIMQVAKVLERFDNYTGQFEHLELRCEYIQEPGSVNKA